MRPLAGTAQLLAGPACHWAGSSPPDRRNRYLLLLVMVMVVPIIGLTVTLISSGGRAVAGSALRALAGWPWATVKTQVSPLRTVKRAAPDAAREHAARARQRKPER